MSREDGATLLLMLTFLVVGASALVLATVSAKRQALAQTADDAAVLARAKDMVLGYALANPRRPGELPFPDRRSDGNDDGNGDCVSTWEEVRGEHLLGHWPMYVEQGCGPDRPAFGAVLRDAGGHRLWYAVARSLTYPQPLLNSSIDDGWLRVHDTTGLVSDRAAFIVFAPGAAIGIQQRTPGVSPAAYLDTVSLHGTLHDNADGDEQFVIAPGDAGFNDRLLVVSRAEFFDAITRRVARTLFAGLETYRQAHGAYPDAAATVTGACTRGQIGGFFPLKPGDCSAAPADLPFWFATQWLGVTRYTRVSPQLATLRFDGCTTVFTVMPGALTPSAEHCG